MQSAYFGDILGLGTPELLIILVILLVLFGGSQLPKLARSLGKSAKELRKGIDDAKGDFTSPDKTNKSDKK
ncbi:MAG TPA: twin-arginine translocase TatA/TatE family subunit [Candidatus Saccharimonadales bacterium]|nr:twin-arginine translocase TatA/TatE family subunit [Candidatus Saccharimonadales bacterium]